MSECHSCVYIKLHGIQYTDICSLSLLSKIIVLKESQAERQTNELR